MLTDKSNQVISKSLLSSEQHRLKEFNDVASLFLRRGAEIFIYTNKMAMKW